MTNTIEDRVRSVEDAIALSEKAVVELQRDLRGKEERLRQAFADVQCVTLLSQHSGGFQDTP